MRSFAEVKSKTPSKHIQICGRVRDGDELKPDQIRAKKKKLWIIQACCKSIIASHLFADLDCVCGGKRSQPLTLFILFRIWNKVCFIFRCSFVCHCIHTHIYFRWFLYTETIELSGATILNWYQTHLHRCRIEKAVHVFHYFSSEIRFWWLKLLWLLFGTLNICTWDQMCEPWCPCFAIHIHSTHRCACRMCAHRCGETEWERERESSNWMLWVWKFLSEMLIYSIQHFCVFRWLGWITSKRLR